MKRLQLVLAAVAGSALFAMMLLTFADIVSRKLLDNSIGGAVELTELFMLVMIFFALPLASLAGEHIVFDLLDRQLPGGVVRWQRALANTVAAAAFTGGAWVVWERAQRTAEYGDITSVLEIRLAPFHQMVAGMLVMTALIHLWQAWASANRAGKDT